VLRIQVLFFSLIPKAVTTTPSSSAVPIIVTFTTVEWQQVIGFHPNVAKKVKFDLEQL
jgi:hypothetical protein